VRYVAAKHRHLYAFAGPTPQFPNPFEQFTVGEVVAYDVLPSHAAGVHSSRLPVAPPLPYVVDVDCLVTTLRYGRPFACGATAAAASACVDPSLTRRRERLMLGAYLDARCKGILFRTNRGRADAVGYLDDRGILTPAALERLAAKLHVVPPAIVPRSPARRPGPPTVTYLGRTFADKGGAVAAAVFAQLADLSIRRVWIGEAASAIRASLPGVAFFEAPTHACTLELLASTDIFVAPTAFESFGMAVIEAAAHGAAIVTTSGPGMEHMDELFVHGENALLVPTDLIESEKPVVVAGHVRTLATNDELRRRLGAAARQLVEGGPLSVERRDRSLLECYSRFAEVDPHGGRAEPDLSWWTLSEEAVATLYRRYTGGSPRRVIVR
jgi:glycosyltransferase involved in cell wall biosynthesis